MIVMIMNLSSLLSSSSSSSEATDCMIARAIVNANTIGVLNNVKGNKDLNDVMIYDDVWYDMMYDMMHDVWYDVRYDVHYV